MIFKAGLVRNAWSKSCCEGFINRRTFSASSKPKKLVLYGDEASPPVRFVAITAKLLGVDYDFHNIDLFKGEHKTELYKKINPLQKVPAMLTDGDVICDSHAIALYLCRSVDCQDLYPEDNILRTKVDQMLYFNATTLFPIDSGIFAEYFAGKWPVDKAKVMQWYSSMDYLEFHLNKYKWLAGDQMRLCDICCAMTLTSLGIIFPLLKTHVKVKEWLNNLDNIPCFDINRRGLKRLKGFVDNIIHSANKTMS